MLFAYNGAAVAKWSANRKVGGSIPGPAVPCRSVLGQDTEPQVAPDAAPSECKCVWVFTWWAGGTLYGSLGLSVWMCVNGEWFLDYVKALWVVVGTRKALYKKTVHPYVWECEYRIKLYFKTLYKYPVKRKFSLWLICFMYKHREHKGFGLFRSHFWHITHDYTHATRTA